MQTVKINTNNNTIISECDSVVIARPGQLMFDSTIAEAKKKGYERPEHMICYGRATEIEKGVYRDDSKVFILPRCINDNTMIIGLVCLSTDDKNDKEELSYLFIYEGESVFITNSNGVEIEVLS
ncbi:hypothetical protein [Gilliamella sp. Occ4-3]|uniref:hypothetical protein n=1 Tax=Gilliamella sp. Occ4-3 TaxID=3120254 RepID=UPI00080D9D4B|nr:hypothetical protein [Gilliamella apicola]OCG72986.1 hypothetical protein A9G44_09270 [Gilliamella apicola]